MAEKKKKPYTWKGSDGNTHEIWAEDADTAAAKASEISQRGGFQLTPEDPSLFVKPGAQPPAGDFPTPDSPPESADPSNRNFVTKNLMRFLPAALMGKPGVGAANTGIGMGVDALTGDDHLTPPGMGTMFSEILSAGLPIGAGAAEKSSIPLLKRFGEMARNSPYGFGAATGAAAGAASTADTGSSPALHGTAGALMSLPGTFVGQRFQNLLKSAPGIANETATAAAEKLGYRPNDVSAERPKLQDLADKMKLVSGVSDELESLGAIPKLFKSKKQEVTAARSSDIMQANAETKRAQGELRNAKIDQAQQRYLDSQKRQDLLDQEAVIKAKRAKFQSADTPTAKALDSELNQVRAQREIHELALTGRVAADDPKVTSARIDLKNKSQRLAALRKINLRNNLGMRDDELDRVALEEVADDIASKTTFDPRKMSADEKASVKWLAQDHPEAIVQTFLADKGASSSRSRGLLQVLGTKSPEVAAIRNQFISQLFSDSVQDTGRFAGRGLSGEKFGTMLSKVRPDALNMMFDNDKASETLRGIEKILVDAEFTREPTSLVHFVMSPASVSSAMTKESGHASLPVALLTAAGVVKAWRSVPAMVDDLLQSNSAVGRALRIYSKNPTPGTLARMQAAAINSKLTTAKPEQTPSAQQ